MVPKNSGFYSERSYTNQAEYVLIAHDVRTHRDASLGAVKLFGLPREEIIGRSLDDYILLNFRETDRSASTTAIRIGVQGRP